MKPSNAPCVFPHMSSLPQTEFKGSAGCPFGCCAAQPCCWCMVCSHEHGMHAVAAELAVSSWVHMRVVAILCVNAGSPGQAPWLQDVCLWHGGAAPICGHCAPVAPVLHACAAGVCAL
eukprot:828035-Pelagomonas_calceolata.AAC.5